MVITYEMISFACGAVIMVGGACAVLYKLIKPVIAIIQKDKTDREEFEERITCIEKHQEKDLERFQCQEELTKVQLKALLSLVNHMIDGNGIESMKKIRNELQDILVNG